MKLCQFALLFLISPFGLTAKEVEKDKPLLATITLDNDKTLVFELFPKENKDLVANFVTLARDQFYDDSYVYSSLKDVALQFGSKDGSGRNEIGHTVDDNFPKTLNYAEKGRLAYSSRGPDMNASNLLITLTKTPHFYGRYPIIGKIKSGMDVVEDLAKAYDDENKPKIKSIKISPESYKIPDFKVRRPFSTDDIKKLTLPKAKRLLTEIHKVQKLGKIKEMEMLYKSIRGRRVQVAYEAESQKKHKSKIILLGRISDDDIDVQQFQFQQVIHRE
ncbi:peptidylprolyl isomerase [Oligoflexaceae bacterium]|nr:peptidylprolyl isomerase [Oligoflexaceae bacterium]